MMQETVKTRIRKAILDRLEEKVPEIATVCSTLQMERVWQRHELPLAAIEMSETLAALGGNPSGKRPMNRTYDIRLELGGMLEDDGVEDELERLQGLVEEALEDGESFLPEGVTGWQLVGAAPWQSIHQIGVGILPVRFTCSIATRPGRGNATLQGA